MGDKRDRGNFWGEIGEKLGRRWRKPSDLKMNKPYLILDKLEVTLLPEKVNIINMITVNAKKWIL